MVAYPAAVASLPRPGPAVPMSTALLSGAEVVDGISDEIEAIEAYLGTLPHVAPGVGTGTVTYSSVRDRLDKTTVSTIVSAKGYGAVGNYNVGTGAGAIDTTALQTAIAAVGLAGGGIVWLGVGTYATNADLVLSSGVSLSGVSPLASVIYDTRTSGTTLKYEGTNTGGSSAGHVQRCTLSNLTVNGNAATNTRTGVRAVHASHLVLHNVEVWNCQRALYGKNWWDSTLTYCRFQQCGSRDGSNVAAVVLQSDSADPSGLVDTNNISFWHTTWESNYDGDLDLTGAGTQRISKIGLHRCKIEAGELRGARRVRIQLADAVTIDSSVFIVSAFASGWTTPVDVVQIVGSDATSVHNCHFAQQASGSATVAAFVRVDGSAVSCVATSLRTLRFAILTSPTAACIVWSGTTPEGDDDPANAITYDPAGPSTLRSGQPSTRRDGRGVRSVSASTTLVPTDGLVVVDATAAARTVTYPASADRWPPVVTIKKSDASANTVTIDTAGAQTIDGAATYTLRTEGETVTLVSTGSTLWVAGTGLAVVAEGGLVDESYATVSVLSTAVAAGSWQPAVYGTLPGASAEPGDFLVLQGVYTIANGSAASADVRHRITVGGTTVLTGPTGIAYAVGNPFAHRVIVVVPIVDATTARVDVGLNVASAAAAGAMQTLNTGKTIVGVGTVTGLNLAADLAVSWDISFTAQDAALSATVYARILGIVKAS